MNLLKFYKSTQTERKKLIWKKFPRINNRLVRPKSRKGFSPIFFFSEN